MTTLTFYTDELMSKNREARTKLRAFLETLQVELVVEVNECEVLDQLILAACDRIPAYISFPEEVVLKALQEVVEHKIQDDPLTQQWLLRLGQELKRG